MSERTERIAALGLGRVGTLTATLLHEADLDVTGSDLHTPQEVYVLFSPKMRTSP